MCITVTVESHYTLELFLLPVAYWKPIFYFKEAAFVMSCEENYKFHSPNTNFIRLIHKSDSCLGCLVLIVNCNTHVVLVRLGDAYKLHPFVYISAE